ncbi:hypothetical protein J7J81_00630 [bacterium]|nr:hypothetical protein [bacterium]
MSLLDSYKRIVNNIWNPKVPFGYFIFTFFSVIALRDFLEIFSAHSNILPWQYFHYGLSYICIVLSLVILFYFALERRQPIMKISRLLLAGFLIVFLAPILDLLVTGGKGMNIGYLLPGVHHHLLRRFLLFGGPFKEIGITWGLKIEVALILGFSFLVFLAFSGKLWRSLFYAFLTYVLFFLFALMPFLAKGLLNLFSIPYHYSGSPRGFLLSLFLFDIYFLIKKSNLDFHICLLNKLLKSL